MLHFSESAYATTLPDEYTVGYYSLQFKRKTNYWTHIQAVGIDGAIDTSPSNTTKLDRRIEALMITGKDFFVAPSIGVRLNVRADWRMKKQEEKEEPKSPADESKLIAEPEFIFTYVTPKGLELFFGTAYHYEGKHHETQSSTVISSTTTFKEIGFTVPRFGLVKRGEIWSGSIYFVQGKETDQDFEKTASDSSIIIGQTNHHVPSEYGIAAKFNLLSSSMEMDFASIQASEGGEKSLDGISVKDDYLRMRLASLIETGIGGFKLSLFHQTLSYSSNAFMSIDTIPVTSMTFDFLTGTRDSHSYFGVVFGKANDGQSIPEFNASFNYLAFGLRFGFLYPF